jgi:protein SCO1/2
VHRASDDGDGVALLSISFDPRDTPERLREYASHFGADGRAWRFARFRDTTTIATMLRAFGVVVIPDGKGDFEHNAAIHVVNADGKLSRVLDADAPPAAVLQAVARR